MKTHYLFPSKFKKIGWTLLVPSVIMGLVTVMLAFEPKVFDVVVPAIFIDEVLGKRQLVGMASNNILNEILGVLIIVSLLLVAFSKEKSEDEYISKIRLESLVWAVYVNYSILLIALLFVFNLSFLWVMLFNMFTVLLFFIIRFNWQISKLHKLAGYDE